MTNKDEFPERKKLRRNGTDYSSCGSYFITICTQEKKPLLWDMASTRAKPLLPRHLLDEDAFEPVLSAHGEAVQQTILNIPNVYSYVSLESYCVMPDHIHMVLSLLSNEFGLPVDHPSISQIIHQFKRAVSRQTGKGFW